MVFSFVPVCVNEWTGHNRKALWTEMHDPYYSIFNALTVDHCYKEWNWRSIRVWGVEFGSLSNRWLRYSKLIAGLRCTLFCFALLDYVVTNLKRCGILRSFLLHRLSVVTCILRAHTGEISPEHDQNEGDDTTLVHYSEAQWGGRNESQTEKMVPGKNVIEMWHVMWHGKSACALS